MDLPLNKAVECAALAPIATNVYLPFWRMLIAGGKIGHIARNCPMNEGSYGGGGFGGQQGGYNDSGKTCYACGGFGTPRTLPSLNCRPYGKGLQPRPKMLQLWSFGTRQPRLRPSCSS